MISLQLCRNKHYANVIGEPLAAQALLTARVVRILGVTVQEVANDGINVNCKNGQVYLMLTKPICMGEFIVYKVVFGKRVPCDESVAFVSAVALNLCVDYVTVKGVVSSITFREAVEEEYRNTQFFIKQEAGGRIMIYTKEPIAVSLAKRLVATLVQYIVLTCGCALSEIWFFGENSCIVDRRIGISATKLRDVTVDFKDLHELSECQLGILQACQDGQRIAKSCLEERLLCNLLLVELSKMLEMFEKFCKLTENIKFKGLKGLFERTDCQHTLVLGEALSRVAKTLPDEALKLLTVWAPRMRNDYIHSGIQPLGVMLPDKYQLDDIHNCALELLSVITSTVWG